jgi:hypothetical protein
LQRQRRETKKAALGATERGSALIVSMFLALVVTGLCTTMLLTSNANHLISANERDHDRALFASKAGLNYGYYLVASRQLEPTASGAGFDSFEEQISTPLEGGSFVGQIFDDGGGVFRLVSTGIYRRASRTTELVLQSTPSSFRYGFVGYNEVNFHMHSPYPHQGFHVEGTVFSNNWIEMHNAIRVSGSMVASGAMEIQEGATPARIDGNVFAYAVDNGGVIDGDVRLLASVTPTSGPPDVSDDAGNPYVWYLDRSNPDSLVTGNGSVTGEVLRHVVQDGEAFRSSLFDADGSLMEEPDLNVVRYLSPPKLDYRAMKAEALENDPTFFGSQFQAVAYLATKRVTETVNGETVTTIKVGTPDRPEFIYVQDELTLQLDPDFDRDSYGSGKLRADGLHIEGGLYTAGDFTFEGQRFQSPERHPEGYEQLRINALPYCYPAIVAYSEPRSGSVDSWTPEDTPPMMAENQSKIVVRSHHPATPVAYEGPVFINGLTYAEYESHFHRMAGDVEKLTFNGAQLGYKVHNCDHFEFTYDPAVSCTRFLDLDGAAGGESKIVSYRELR